MPACGTGRMTQRVGGFTPRSDRGIGGGDRGYWARVRGGGVAPGPGLDVRCAMGEGREKARRGEGGRVMETEGKYHASA